MAHRYVWVLAMFSVWWELSTITVGQMYPVIVKHEMKYNEKFINATIVTAGEHERNKSFLCHIVPMRETRDLKGYFGYSIRALNGAIQSTIISRWLDVCEFFRRPSIDRLIKIFYDVIKPDSVLPARCPIPKGHHVMVNITPVKMPVPAFVPNSDFLVEVNLYAGLRKEKIYESRWYGQMTKLPTNNN